MAADRVHRRAVLQAVGGAIVATPAVASGADGAFFDVSVSHSPAVVETDDTSVVTGTITNTGDESAVQIIELVVRRDGEVVDSRSTTYSLDAGESDTETRTAEYDDYDGPGKYVGEVCSDDDCATASWRVAYPDGSVPALFAVELADLSNPTAGQPVEATVTVSNTGDYADTQELAVSVDGLGTQTTELSLEGRETATLTVSIPTESDDEGEYAVTASTADDTDSGEVTVSSQPSTQPASFAVTLLDVPTTVAGDPVVAEVLVSNAGDESGTRPVTLDVSDLGTDERSVSLDGGEETTVSFAIPTEPGGAGEYDVTVSSPDASDGGTVLVEPRPSSVAVDITEVNSPSPGQPIETAVVVTNPGGEPVEGEVTLAVEDLGSTSEVISLEAGAEATVTLSVPTEAGDSGEYPLTVSSGDDSDSDSVTVGPAAAGFGVEIVAVTTPVAGDPVAVDVAVENLGTEPRTGALDLEIDGLGSDTETVDLDGGAAARVSLSVPTGVDDAGEYEAIVTSEADRDTRGVTVDPRPAFVAVEITDLVEPIAGDPVEATVRVANRGDEAAEQEVTFAVDGLGSDSATLALDGGEELTASLSVPTADGDAGEYTATVASDDESDTRSVSVAPETNGDTDGETGLADENRSTDADGAGFTLTGAFAGLTGTVGYLLKRRLETTLNRE